MGNDSLHKCMQKARDFVEAYCITYFLNGDMNTPIFPSIEAITRVHQDWQALVSTDLMDGYGKTWMFMVSHNSETGHTRLTAYKKIETVHVDYGDATLTELLLVLARLKKSSESQSNVTEVIDNPVAKIHTSHTTKWVEGGTVLTCITCKLCSCHDRDEALTKPCAGK